MNRTSLNRTYAEKSASTVLVTDQDRLPARLSGGREREVMYVRMTRLPGSLTAMVGRAQTRARSNARHEFRVRDPLPQAGSGGRNPVGVVVKGTVRG